jgi:dTDP-4-dehydrorhamnose 3,5-epimerase
MDALIGSCILEVAALEIPEVKILKPKKLGDHRGFFSEVYSQRVLAEFGLDLEFVQDNHSYSAAAGTLRGFHFQTPPFAQDKLVRVVRGRVLDVAIDLRRDSPTFGRHVSAEISAAGWNQILVPKGFGHAILTLDPDTEILYKVTNYYEPEHDKGLLWNDPALGIEWPIPREKIVISDRDSKHPTLKDLSVYF